MLSPEKKVMIVGVSEERWQTGSVVEREKKMHECMREESGADSKQMQRVKKNEWHDYE